MNPSYLDLPPFDKESGSLNAIIESPKGARNKYKFDPETGLFRMSKTIPLGMVIPLDFGFIPGTKGGDGDPLDILVLMAEPTFCGCVVPTRLIGAIEAEQTQEKKAFRNDRLIGVALNQPMYAKVNSLKELDRRLIEQLKIFFIAYNEGQGRKFKPLRDLEAGAAKKLVEKYQV